MNNQGYTSQQINLDKKYRSASEKEKVKIKLLFEYEEDYIVNNSLTIFRLMPEMIEEFMDTRGCDSFFAYKETFMDMNYISAKDLNFLYRYMLSMTRTIATELFYPKRIKKIEELIEFAEAKDIETIGMILQLEKAKNNETLTKKIVIDKRNLSQYTGQPTKEGLEAIITSGYVCEAIKRNPSFEIPLNEMQVQMINDGVLEELEDQCESFKGYVSLIIDQDIRMMIQTYFEVKEERERGTMAVNTTAYKEKINSMKGMNKKEYMKEWIQANLIDGRTWMYSKKDLQEFSKVMREQESKKTVNI